MVKKDERRKNTNIISRTKSPYTIPRPKTLLIWFVRAPENYLTAPQPDAPRPIPVQFDWWPFRELSSVVRLASPPFPINPRGTRGRMLAGNIFNKNPPFQFQTYSFIGEMSRAMFVVWIEWNFNLTCAVSTHMFSNTHTHWVVRIGCCRINCISLPRSSILLMAVVDLIKKYRCTKLLLYIVNHQRCLIYFKFVSPIAI